MIFWILYRNKSFTCQKLLSYVFAQMLFFEPNKNVSETEILMFFLVISCNFQEFLRFFEVFEATNTIKKLSFQKNEEKYQQARLRSIQLAFN